MRRALVTGVAGQDGVYLARSLLADGWQVLGTISPGSESAERNRPYLQGVELVDLDLREPTTIAGVVREAAPDAVWNLAALSSVARSWQQPEVTHRVNAEAVDHLVRALLDLRAATGREVRLFQASSSEVRGEAAHSPYARAKAEAERTVGSARRDHGLHASCGILFNHESPLRPRTFVTRKVTAGAAGIALGRCESVTLGNLGVRRDWGFAGDHVRAMRLMLEADQPGDLEIGTGVAHELSELVEIAFAAAGLGDPAPFLVHDPDLVRPADATVTVADPRPARERLGWVARTSFADTVRHMVRVDLARLRSGVAEQVGYLLPDRR